MSRIEGNPGLVPWTLEPDGGNSNLVPWTLTPHTNLPSFSSQLSSSERGSCHVPSTTCKPPLKILIILFHPSIHPIYRTCIISSHFIRWTQIITSHRLSSSHATLVEFCSCKPVDLPSSHPVLSDLFHPAL